MFLVYQTNLIFKNIMCEMDPQFLSFMAFVDKKNVLEIINSNTEVLLLMLFMSINVPNMSISKSRQENLVQSKYAICIELDRAGHAEAGHVR